MIFFPNIVQLCTALSTFHYKWFDFSPLGKVHVISFPLNTIVHTTFGFLTIIETRNKGVLNRPVQLSRQVTQRLYTVFCNVSLQQDISYKEPYLFLGQISRKPSIPCSLLPDLVSVSGIINVYNAAQLLNQNKIEYYYTEYFIINLSNIITVIQLFYFVGTVQVLYNLSIVKSVLTLSQVMYILSNI